MRHIIYTKKRVMKKNLGYVLGLFLGLNIVFAQTPIKVMTYNIKLDYPKEGKNSWDNRKDLIVGQFKFYEPDIFGVQEALPNQMQYLDSLLVDYNYVGVGRDNGENGGEYSAIFYNKQEFRLIKSSTFWLSETPDKVSMGWDAVCNRICTYALFESYNTQQRFWLFNTHLDHVGKIAKRESPKLILRKVDTLNHQNLPVILMGDFNLESEAENIKELYTYFNDSKTISKSKSFGPIGTYNGFHFERPVTRRIDYIFTSKKNIQVSKHGVLSDSKDFKYPSDHLPVYVELKLE